jgi:5-methylthioadenosine/S-adenosylhomocysteine deaminase
MRRLTTYGCLAALLISLAEFCASAQGQNVSYALKGTIVTPDQVIERGFVLVAGDKIQAVGSDTELPPGVRVVEASGLILPGFIDLHNHLTWNLFPRWKPSKEFANRYEWQQIPAYGIALSTPHAELFKSDLGCEMNRYAEVKAITEGETAVVGSLFPPQECIEGLARNLDFYSGFYQPRILGAEKLRYEVFPLELDVSEATKINNALDRKDLTAFIVHLAEGRPDDASAAREFKMFVARGFLRPGVSIIHGDALKPADFRLMADRAVGLLWSPRSNVELYGATTDVAAARHENVKIALSPDWSPTGSDGMLEELKYAATWNAGQVPPVFTNAELVRMTTTYPAQLAGLSDKIGTIATGRYADLVVLTRVDKDPYDSVIHASPANVKLVIIGGEPVYGDLELMESFISHERLEPLAVCGAKKAIYFGSESRLQRGTPASWIQTTKVLGAALEKWGSSLDPLADCDK